LRPDKLKEGEREGRKWGPTKRSFLCAIVGDG